MPPMYTIRLNVHEKLPKSINEFRDIRRCNDETNTMWVHLSSINQKNVEKIAVVNMKKKIKYSTSLKISNQVSTVYGFSNMNGWVVGCLFNELLHIEIFLDPYVSVSLCGGFNFLIR